MGHPGAGATGGPRVSPRRDNAAGAAAARSPPGSSVVTLAAPLPGVFSRHTNDVRPPFVVPSAIGDLRDEVRAALSDSSLTLLPPFTI
jgi:hypothetical protein